jgi:hypothetical protein
MVTMMVGDRRPTYSKWGMLLSCTSCRVPDVLGTCIDVMDVVDISWLSSFESCGRHDCR